MDAEENKEEIIEFNANQDEKLKHSFLSPLVRSIIEKEGITNDDLNKIEG